MYRIFTTILIFAFFINVDAKKKNYSDEKQSFTAKWKIKNSVRKLYDTPLGAVYRFELTEYFDCYPTKKAPQECTVHHLAFDMPVNYKNRKPKYRFLVIEFTIRTFPAISGNSNPQLRFSLFRSFSQADSISTNFDINGIREYGHSNTGYLSNSFEESPKKSRKPLFIVYGNKYMPYYEPVKCRLIFDNKKYSVYSVNYNGWKRIDYHLENDNIYPLGNSYGICIQKPIGKTKTWPRKYLEISPPKITMTNNENDLKELPPLVYSSYNFSTVNLETTKIRRIKNPDIIYACALELLVGKDLPEGLKLMKKAADEEHILAMYQLGICYLRGIGTEKKFKKAFKWFKRAAKYHLPEALAMLSQLAFENNRSVYIHDSSKKVISKSRNAFVPEVKLDNYNTGGDPKNENLIITHQLYSTNCTRFGVNLHPKLALWNARSSFAKKYYKNILPPDLKDEEKITKNNYQTWTRAKVKRYKKIDKFEKMEEEEVPKSFAKRSFSRGSPKYPWKKFYEIRNLNISGGGQAFLDTALDANYPPAILYQGRLKVESERNIKEALRIFKKGASLGSLECALEALHCRVRLKDIIISEFTPDLDVKFADFPLYYMLKYMTDNPDAPGVKEYLNLEYSKAREIWRKADTPWNNFLLGSEILYSYFNFGFDTCRYRIYWQQTNELSQAFDYLQKAAASKISPALYLMGKIHLNGTKCKNRLETGIGMAIELLTKAEKTGHINAKVLLTRIKLSNNNYPDKSIIQYLSSARKADSGEAWMLTTDAFAANFKTNKKYEKLVVKGYLKAAKLGCHQAYNRLGYIYYKGMYPILKDLKKAEKYWSLFVKYDKIQRELDFNDLYCSKAFEPLIIGKDIHGKPFPCSGKVKPKAKLYEYCEIY